MVDGVVAAPLRYIVQFCWASKKGTRAGLRVGFPSPGPDGPCRARTGRVGYGAVHDFGVPQKAPAGVTCRAGPHSEPRTELGVVAALALIN